jgi:hypothetical protein
VARRSIVALATAALLLAGCGSDGGADKPRAPQAATSAKLRAELKGATASTAADFPPAAGRSLQAVANGADLTGTQVGLAGSVYTVGKNRLAFGVIDPKSGFVYGKTAVYVADRPQAKARGPYPAPADLLITDPAFRSQTAATEKDVFAAIYETEVPLERAGTSSVVVMTKVGGKLAVATTQLKVIPPSRDQIPRPGEKPPAITTDTVQSANGDIKSIDTRVPPDDMHDANFADVVGKKPVALLFATPALCASRVCGPVVDIAAQLKATYGDRIEFIHQEVYVDNDPSKGLREPLRRFHLQTEPWLFILDRSGRVTSRMEGSFGFNAFERALKSAL